MVQEEVQDQGDDGTGEDGAGGSQQTDVRELTDLITDGSTNYSQLPELEGVGLFWLTSSDH